MPDKMGNAPVNWNVIIANVAITAVVSTFVALIAFTWSGATQRVDKLEDRLNKIEPDLRELRITTKDLPQSLRELTAGIAELRGLVQGLLQTLPPRQRAEAFGLRAPQIELVKLSVGSKFRLQRSGPPFPLDLTFNLTNISGDVLTYSFEGYVSNAEFRGGLAKVSVQPGHAFPILIPTPPDLRTLRPLLYLVILEKTRDTALIAIGPREQQGAS